jgi:nitric oxide reductase NorD protein
MAGYLFSPYFFAVVKNCFLPCNFNKTLLIKDKKTNAHVDNIMDEPLKSLSMFDPELANDVLALLTSQNAEFSPTHIEMLVEESFQGMNQEISFGYAIALGFAEILGKGKASKIEIFRDLIRKTSQKGPTLGLLMAKHLPPVMIYGTKHILQKFLSTVSIMESKGTYTLKTALEVLSELLNSREHAAASSFLDLLSETFSKNITYNQSLHLSHIIPDAVRSFPIDTRAWLIPLLTKVIAVDIHLSEPFVEGYEKGLNLLSQEALNQFIDLGLEKLVHGRNMASKFISLESRMGLETFQQLQVTASLEQVRFQLDQYLQARTGMALSVRPLAELPDKFLKKTNNSISVLSDGRFIYLPDKIGVYSSHEKNILLYKYLTKLEAGLIEFGTFDFDPEKIEGINGFSMKAADQKISTLECFLNNFSIKTLAQDLWTVFEHGRIHYLMAKKYPGMLKRSMPLLNDEISRLLDQNDTPSPIFYLYVKIMLGILPDKAMIHDELEFINNIATIFQNTISQKPIAETSALLVLEFFPILERFFTSDYTPLKTPFQRKIQPQLYFSTFKHYEDLAASIKLKLQKQGIRVFKSDIRKRLIEKKGRLTIDDLKDMVLMSRIAQNDIENKPIRLDFSDLELSNFVEKSDFTVCSQSEEAGSVFWYREWDFRMKDYIHDHVRILDRNMTEKKDDFYQQTLIKYQGLVSRIQYAFELLKPESLKILKPWVEGDDFDYRAMLDFAIDKKAGWLPSDRLYIKRLKQQRDVAVLLLVDLSKSTSNLVFESTHTVLDVEKEAIVLFCEALKVLGDKSAIAGFSGTGRLGVDYYRIKDFTETLDETVKWRINAMSPQRSTRMGAAIRHAVHELGKVEAAVRLLILLGDGFPNDSDYKQSYAIEDTRKAASEALAGNISFRAITVNIAGDQRLDDLFGNVQYSVISDVRELPDKFLRIYSALTKY